jgi:hypothetical protein
MSSCIDVFENFPNKSNDLHTECGMNLLLHNVRGMPGWEQHIETRSSQRQIVDSATLPVCPAVEKVYP